MIRRIASAIVATAAILAAAGVQAETPTGYYVATPVAKVEKTRLITRSTLWSQQNGAFVAARAPERDTVLCQLVARDVGGLSAFSVGGKAYDDAQLEKCNGKAKLPAQNVAAN
ncbi:hypothetical protein KZ810_04975 [Sphingomonas sp. RHCKR47]|uniref:CC_3452 family protein n=1 Tax=Sphingomonas citricola TaxID=2862498 RepID=UPI001CA530BF|nr:hypothetical protein [Sphingomonas citricola]MBW6522845.1 hypothetical protein [Sphingomonas citricola]